MKVAIEYEKDQYLEFENHSINMVVGYNQELKWKIIRSLYRFNEGKQLDLLEENVYGDDGLSILIDDKLMKAKQLKILPITSFSEMNQQASIGKNTLMQFFITQKLNDMTIQHQFEMLRDYYILVEQRLNELFEKEKLENIMLKTEMPKLNDVLKQATIIGQNDVPLPLMDSNQLVNTYLRLLRYYLENQSSYVLILLRHEDDFLNVDSLDVFYRSLRELAEKYPQLIILAVKDNQKIKIADYNTEEIIFVGDSIQQLPPFDIIKKSIYLNYPVEFRLSDEELVDQLAYILPNINIKMDSDPSTNMVLYDVVQSLLK